MTSTLDELFARARDPRMIPGIYNYCDRRCPRCRFTDRCATFVDTDATHGNGPPVDHTLFEILGPTLQRTADLIAEIARAEGIDLDALPGAPSDEDVDAKLAAHERDPLVAAAHEYGRLAWRVGRAAEPIVAARGDPALVDAVDTILWFSSLIAPKLFRAVTSAADEPHGSHDVQTDANGSAKVALLGICASRTAWEVLMEVGKATANGVPAQAVKLLARLDEDVRARFPHADAFVRPGFDTEPGAT